MMDSKEVADKASLQTSEEVLNMKEDGKLQTETDAERTLPDEEYLPSGEVKPNEPTPDGLQPFDDVILAFMREHHIPGLSVALSRKGSLLYAQSYGFASRHVLLRPSHLFRIASISKICTAVGVLKLYEDKKLLLSSKVFGPKGLLSEFVPALGGDRRLLRVTVRHLLQHSAGWDRELAGDPCFFKHVGAEMGAAVPVDQATLIKYMMGQKLQFTPGTKYAYSNFGYIVLGRVIERTSGSSYEGYIRALLSEIGTTRMKLGRSRKCHADPDEVEYFVPAKFRSVDSVLPEGGKVCSPYGGYCMESGDSDGGWIASPLDLLNVAHGLEGVGVGGGGGVGEARLLTPDTFRVMRERPPYARRGDQCWYGLGLDVSWGRRAWEHGGHIDGATGTLTRDRHGFAWALLCNYWPADTDYTSLVGYAVSAAVGGGAAWACRVPRSLHPGADGATGDKSHVYKLRMPRPEWEATNDRFVCLGYRPVWLDGYLVKGRTFFNAIWTREAQPWQARERLRGGRELEAAGREMAARGYRPRHVDAYRGADGHVTYTLLAEQSAHEDGPWVLEHDVPETELESRVRDMEAKGYGLTQLAPCSPAAAAADGSPVTMALLFEKPRLKGVWARVALTPESYQSEFQRRCRFGHLLSHVKAYPTTEDGGQVSFGAVWTDPGPFLYTAEHDMSPHRLMLDLSLATHRRFVPRCIGGYESEGAHKFVAVCVKPLPLGNKRKK